MAGVSSGAIEWSRDVGQARWLIQRLRDDRVGETTVGHRVPSGYESYARLLHSISAVDGSKYQWSEVARRNGWTAHAQMKFKAVAIPRAGADDPIISW